MLEYGFSLFNLFLAFYCCCLNFISCYDVIPGHPYTFNAKPVNEDLVLTPWISDNISLGQVAGVSIDPDDNIYLFHRADRVWDDQSFIDGNIYAQKDLGPITISTILVFNNDGTLLNQLGRNMFYLPHGITVDSDFNIWVTDVALHQVMKLSPRSNSSSLVLGEKFIPGRDSKHFCKPTSIAVVSNGDFFVADGYCNSRILKFNSEGKKILEWGRETSLVHPPGKYELNVPHALTLVEDKGQICTADRENGRIVCYRIEDGSYVSHMSSSVMGPQIFSVAYSNGRFFAVNGMQTSLPGPHGHGFILTQSEIVGQFGKNLKSPHDIAVSSNGSFVYVVEINPYKAWKYVVHTNNALPDVTQKDETHSNIIAYSNSVNNVEGLTGAVLVTFGCFVFAIGLLMAVLIYSKSRRTHSSDTRSLLSNMDY